MLTNCDLLCDLLWILLLRMCFNCWSKFGFRMFQEERRHTTIFLVHHVFWVPQFLEPFGSAVLDLLLNCGVLPRAPLLTWSRIIWRGLWVTKALTPPIWAMSKSSNPNQSAHISWFNPRHRAASAICWETPQTTGKISSMSFLFTGCHWSFAFLMITFFAKKSGALHDTSSTEKLCPKPEARNDKAQAPPA